ncbi:hypothetical protein Rhe02_63120 [Rhizocola hellebori]|uniref:Aminoglycoside phosphotransferase domain-containing protein n=1 Tax=Rhizocola hellebori TaxID=1392758 RepID=A0A8J3VJ40_9ACTN|nr:phosphotransferase [Rhizocola hellebori]GIH08245.1 hypothetical protein Rhe02_63120 [Rhizocola hellebori]
MVQARSAAKVVLVDDASGLVLCDERSGTVQLPELRFESAWPPLGGRLSEAIAAQIGVCGRVLEPLDFVTVVMTAGPGQDAPVGYSWRPPADVYGQVTVVDRFLDQDRWRPPWYRTGWAERADAYVDEVLAATGRRRLGDSQQVKHWSLSAVLRTAADGGDVFLKSGLPPYAHEPAVTSWLATQGCGPFATIVAAAAPDAWWVANDFGGADGQKGSPADQARILAQLCRVQVAMLDQTEALFALGCRPLRMADLASTIPDLLSRDDLWAAPKELRNLHRAFDAHEATQLRGLGSFLSRCCADLETAGMPDTLIHGDFHPGNAVLRADGVLLHDWSFAAIGNPLLDLACARYDASPEQAAAGFDAYLSGWSGVVDPAALRRAWRPAGPISAFAELVKFVGLVDLVGEAHAFNYLPVVYGWARRLLGACAADRA